jgi:hypothetical protein
VHRRHLGNDSRKKAQEKQKIKLRFFAANKKAKRPKQIERLATNFLR